VRQSEHVKAGRVDRSGEQGEVGGDLGFRCLSATPNVTWSFSHIDAPSPVADTQNISHPAT